MTREDEKVMRQKCESIRSRSDGEMRSKCEKVIEEKCEEKGRRSDEEVRESSGEGSPGDGV